MKKNVLNLITINNNGYESVIRHVSAKKLTYAGAQRIINKTYAGAVVTHIEAIGV